MNEAKVTLEEKKKEAVKRMRILKIYPATIRQFEKDDKVSISMGPMGAFYWADEGTMAKIRQFEKDHNALVYMGIRCYLGEDEVDNLFYVSDYKEEWELDHEDMKEKMQVVYVHNNSCPLYSEIGKIGYEHTCGAGLRRMW